MPLMYLQLSQQSVVEEYVCNIAPKYDLIYFRFALKLIFFLSEGVFAVTIDKESHLFVSLFVCCSLYFSLFFIFFVKSLLPYVILTLYTGQGFRALDCRHNKYEEGVKT